MEAGWDLALEQDSAMEQDSALEAMEDWVHRRQLGNQSTGNNWAYPGHLILCHTWQSSSCCPKDWKLTCQDDPQESGQQPQKHEDMPWMCRSDFSGLYRLNCRPKRCVCLGQRYRHMNHSY